VRRWWTKRNRTACAFLTVAAVAAVGLWRIEHLAHQTHALAEQNRILVRQGIEAHKALCVFRSYRVQKRDEAQRYLDEQKGDPIVVFGLQIPRDTLEASVSDQQQVVESLGDLKCKETP
jgi:hypothetical protein